MIAHASPSSPQPHIELASAGSLVLSSKGPELALDNSVKLLAYSLAARRWP
jgi:hypothetical protein